MRRKRFGEREAADFARERLDRAVLDLEQALLLSEVLDEPEGPRVRAAHARSLAVPCQTHMQTGFAGHDVPRLIWPSVIAYRIPSRLRPTASRARGARRHPEGSGA